MPYVECRRTRIHYQADADGPTLVLPHGFTQSLGDWYECGYVEALKLPCLVYAGEQDGVFPRAQATAGKLPHATCVGLPDLNHGDAFVRADLVLPHVTAFLFRYWTGT